MVKWIYLEFEFTNPKPNPIQHLLNSQFHHYSKLKKWHPHYFTQIHKHIDCNKTFTSFTKLQRNKQRLKIAMQYLNGTWDLGVDFSTFKHNIKCCAFVTFSISYSNVHKEKGSNNPKYKKNKSYWFALKEFDINLVKMLQFDTLI